MNIRDCIAKIDTGKGTAFLALLLGAIYFAAFQTVLSHVVIYHEEHQLFLFSSEYLYHTFHWAGWASVPANFLIQFFYYRWLGSFLLSVLLVLLYLVFHRGIAGLLGGRDCFQLAMIPSLVAFLYMCTVSHSVSTLVASVGYSWVAVESLLFVRKRVWRFKFPGNSFHFRPLYTWLCVGIYGVAAYFCFWKQYPYNERRLYWVSHLANESQWERVNHYTEAYFRSGRTNNMMTYYHNLGLYHRGKLVERLLQYNRQLGPQGLFLPWKGSKDDVEFGALLYERLGQLNIAHRWEFEAMVKYGETAPHLLRLSKYNIVLGRPEVARHFIRKLQKSLFYASAADQLALQLNTRQVNGLHHAFEGRTCETFFQPTQLSVNLEEIMKADPSNKMAYEYLMCELLLSHELDKFAQWYERAAEFYSPVPKLFQETMDYYHTKKTRSAYE